VLNVDVLHLVRAPLHLYGKEKEVYRKYIVEGYERFPDNPIVMQAMAGLAR
jgi:hypothetical protein